MELSVLYFNGLPVKISDVFLSLKIVQTLMLKGHFIRTFTACHNLSTTSKYLNLFKLLKGQNQITHTCTKKLEYVQTK